MVITGRVVLAVFILLVFSSMKARALEYRLPDLQGEIQSLDQYKGQWVVVNYWASWCGSCVKELPDLAELHEENKDSNIVVVGINYETISEDRLKGFVEAYEIPYPIWRSAELPITPLGNVPALPTTYIIDPEGNVIAGEVGVISKHALKNFIAKKMTLEKYSKYTIGQNG